MNLTFEGVRAAYRKKAVLEDVSFSVESGSITALIGRNGTGKSTLINCLTGQKQDYLGKIRLNGQEVRRMSMGERACKLACLPQNLPLPHITVGELVSFGRTPYTPLGGTLSPADREKITWAMDAVGITGLQDAFVNTLSGGERKKAFFAMILAQDTPMVVLDEPTAHLDTVSRFEFMELLERMRRETGKTFLIVMHELTEVLRCAHKIVTLHQGGVVFDGSPEQCLAAHIPQACFQIRITGNKEQGYAAVPLFL